MPESKKKTLDGAKLYLILLALDAKLKELSVLPEPLASQVMQPFLELREMVVGWLNEEAK